MRIQSFRICNCFGFRDSGRINLREDRNLIYLLGRNSSGKSMVLTALDSFNLGKIPKDFHENFHNFGKRKSDEEALFAEFAIRKGDVSLASYMQHFTRWLNQRSGIDPNIMRSEPFKQQLQTITQQLNSIYGDLIQQLQTAQTVWIKKSGNGDYLFSPDQSFEEAKQRVMQVQQILNKAFPNGRLILPNGQTQPVQMAAESIEGILYEDFSRIILFNATYSLRDSLPRQITPLHIANLQGQNQLARVFIEYLEGEKVARLLDPEDRAEAPEEQNLLLAEIQKKVDDVTDQVNKMLTQEHTDLLKMRLTLAIEGLQITVYTSNKPSYYSQISDNTKLLFAYHLYKQVLKIQTDILLFDEPDNGFHASAQEQLFNFLRELGEKGNLVILATHSAYLIDPDHLTGIRLMSSDDKGCLMVHNHYHSPLSGKNQADLLALRPITEAIGLKYGANKLVITDRIIVTEGITDMLYLRAFNILLYKGEDLQIAPARGNNTIPQIISLLISQGLRFKVLMDSDKHTAIIKEGLKKDFGMEDCHIWQVPIPSTSSQREGSGIEDLFSKDDFKKLLEGYSGTSVGADFDTMSNSNYIKKPLSGSVAQSGPKRLLAEWFCQGIHRYQAGDFSEETVNNFREALLFCKNENWFNR
jgi:predicted ATP-dependent endonuclease of OLD family